MKSARNQAERNEKDAYRHADAALLQHLTKFSARTFSLIDEVIVDRFGNSLGRILILRPLFKVDGEVEAAMERMSRCPGFDEFISLGVEVLVRNGVGSIELNNCAISRTRSANL